MLRSLSRSLARSLVLSVLATGLTAVAVPLAAAPAAADTVSARAQVAPMSKAPWKSSATRRALPTTTTVVVPRTAPAPTPVAAPAPVPAPAPAVSATQAYQDRVLVLTNLERTGRGLAPLALSTCADGFADRWAGTLLGLGSLSHQALGPVMTSCAASTAGENVAYGNVTPERLVAMWMASEGHRANILNPTFSRIGVGAVSSSTGRWYGVQVFVRA